MKTITIEIITKSMLNSLIMNFHLSKLNNSHGIYHILEKKAILRSIHWSMCMKMESNQKLLFSSLLQNHIMCIQMEKAHYILGRIHGNASIVLLLHSHRMKIYKSILMILLLDLKVFYQMTSRILYNQLN